MILNNAPVNAAIMHNVSSVGEFHIRNSAKAFSILSSGLYANKIRAIVRELSCNAVDSHVAARKEDVQFDVHLPNAFEPWFSVKDYGIGLSHSQVVNMYTTYFESTKTGSNDFIGALGLGSKSPFSYTDNFTVKAIKDGILNIYSAIINEEGVPSIVLMQTLDTLECNGVEISFAVNDRNDFYKFNVEAKQVFTYFKNKPKILGCADFEFIELKYETENIIPGASFLSGFRNSVAVMGNIAYPIDMPNAEKNLGNLSNLLLAGLELHFNIGELDFQASREGLSYIPSTIQNIKTKLEAVNAQLAVYIEQEANAISNTWERVQFLEDKRLVGIWSASVSLYASKNPCPLYTVGTSHVSVKPIILDIKALQTKYNISLSHYSGYRGRVTKTNPYVFKGYMAQGAPVYADELKVNTLNTRTLFIIDDLKRGVLSRCKYAVANTSLSDHFIIGAFNPKLAVDTKGFFDEIMNPPASYIIKASSLAEKPKKERTVAEHKAINILRLENGYNDMKWKQAGTSADYSDAGTYYYIPIVGYNAADTCITKNARNTKYNMERCGIDELATVTLYGVRKSDLETVKGMKNWVNAEDFIKESLHKASKKNISQLALSESDTDRFQFKNKAIIDALDPKSPLVVFLKKYQKVVIKSYNKHSLNELIKEYNSGNYLVQKIEKKVKSFTEDNKKVHATYPLLSRLTNSDGTFFNLEEVANYIKMVDNSSAV